MARYKVVIVGMGPRGLVHGQAFLRNSDRFEIAAVCDLDRTRLEEVGNALGVSARYTDADTMLSEVKPDVFCFATLPKIRLSLIELAVKHKVKAIAFEKPLATTLEEAAEIVRLCKENGIKAVVSHQMRYLTSFRKLKELLDAGEIGEVTRMHATTLPWLAQLGTHYVNYMLWLNGASPAKWVVGHVHGKERLSDSHPSPDYAFGQVLFDNGVRGIIESGYLSPTFIEDKFWVSNRMTVYGTHGYAWAETDGRWGAFTKNSGGETTGKQDGTWSEQRLDIQEAYIKDLADWLDEDSRVHYSNVEIAYRGYEILEAICLSSLDRVKVELPLDPKTCGDLIQRMAQELPE